jgi:hypothetical protein
MTNGAKKQTNFKSQIANDKRGKEANKFQMTNGKWGQKTIWNLLFAI